MQNTRQLEIYEPAFIARLFDEMAASYGLTNFVSSFGFCRRWRRQCVEGLELEPGGVVLDLMTGMGECWEFIRRRLGGRGRVLALDLSSEMCRRARRNASGITDVPVTVWRDDVLQLALPEASVDHVVASFGLKTFSPDQLARLARQVCHVLKPGGSFSFVEISVPESRILRAPYLFYLRWCIPVIGQIFLGNPDNYRLLAVYTERFSNGAHVVDVLSRAGLLARTEGLFFGCARRFTGIKKAG